MRINEKQEFGLIIRFRMYITGYIKEVIEYVDVREGRKGKIWFRHLIQI
jgi:hypothetical protein